MDLWNSASSNNVHQFLPLLHCSGIGTSRPCMQYVDWRLLKPGSGNAASNNRCKTHDRNPYGWLLLTGYHSNRFCKGSPGHLQDQEAVGTLCKARNYESLCSFADCTSLKKCCGPVVFISFGMPGSSIRHSGRYSGFSLKQPDV